MEDVVETAPNGTSESSGSVCPSGFTVVGDGNSRADLPPPGGIDAVDLVKRYRLWKDPSAQLQAPLLRAVGRIVPGSPGRWLSRQAQRLYFDHDALAGVTLRIEPGESVGIIGRNGSGKSTLLSLICEALRPTSGHVQVNGRIAALLQLGAGFNPEFTGRENVYLNASLMGVSRREIRRRFEEIVQFADIGSFIDQPLKTYSSGMVVRLGFSVNVLLEPDIFLIDEALAVGDIFFQQKCYRFLRNEFKEKTRILVTHDMHALSSIARRVIVLHRGRIVFDGPTREGVSLYTKLMQDETFAVRPDASEDEEANPSPVREERGEGKPSPEGGAPRREDGAAPLQLSERPVTDPAWHDHEPGWKVPPGEGLAGRREVIFEGARLIDAQRQPVHLVQPDDDLRVQAVIQVKKSPVELIFGFFVRDRFGHDICGDTHLPRHGGPSLVTEPGRYRVAFSLRWPYLKPGEYTITLGVGEGDSPFNHIIQCWAHNIFHVNAISPMYDIHNLFTLPMESFRMDSLNTTPDGQQ